MDTNKNARFLSIVWRVVIVKHNLHVAGVVVVVFIVV